MFKKIRNLFIADNNMLDLSRKDIIKLIAVATEGLMFKELN